LLARTKRIAPGETNTWFIKVRGTEFSAEFSTKYPKTLRTLTYRRGEPQAWQGRQGQVTADGRDGLPRKQIPELRPFRDGALRVRQRIGGAQAWAASRNLISA
jgi:hypothetical protein